MKPSIYYSEKFNQIIISTIPNIFLVVDCATYQVNPITHDTLNKLMVNGDFRAI